MIPQDDAFYLRLIQMAHTLGIKHPEDLLVVMASETNLDPSSTKGLPFRGLNTMSVDVARAAGISDYEWARLPDMTATDNLPYSEKYFQYLLHATGRNHFVNALDLYLSNAAYGIWAKPPIMPGTVMYGGGPGNPWASNYTMDNYPVATSFTGTAEERLAHAKSEIGKSLKGYVSIEDLRQFMLRDNVKPTWQAASKKLQAIMAQAGLTTTPNYSPVGYTPSGGYTPDTSYDEINADRGTPTRIDGRASQSGGIPSWLKWMVGGALGYGAYRAVAK